jgi:hypothetical protein
MGEEEVEVHLDELLSDSAHGKLAVAAK